jgi:hypothetical protein
LHDEAVVRLVGIEEREHGTRRARDDAARRQANRR